MLDIAYALLPEQLLLSRQERAYFEPCYARHTKPSLYSLIIMLVNIYRAKKEIIAYFKTKKGNY